MAEPPATAPAGVAVSGHDVLLATKLHLPRRRPGFVPRPRLADRLHEGLARGLVLVCAPAGYGKTAVLADWARCSGRPVARLSLDPPPRRIRQPVTRAEASATEGSRTDEPRAVRATWL
jgi:LuxR family maltose regulon positive regulatory protein